MVILPIYPHIRYLTANSWGTLIIYIVTWCQKWCSWHMQLCSHGKNLNSVITTITHVYVTFRTCSNSTVHVLIKLTSIRTTCTQLPCLSKMVTQQFLSVTKMKPLASTVQETTWDAQFLSAASFCTKIVYQITFNGKSTYAVSPIVCNK